MDWSKEQILPQAQDDEKKYDKIIMLRKFNFELKQGQGDYQLLPVEFYAEQIPFEVKRTYFILSGETETQTGQHAHYEEEEVFLVVKGRVDLVSLDENGEEYILPLIQGEAVYVPNQVWHGFLKLEAGTVLTAFSSTHHQSDRSDYLDNKQEYLKLIKNC